MRLHLERDQGLERVPENRVVKFAHLCKVESFDWLRSRSNLTTCLNWIVFLGNSTLHCWIGVFFIRSYLSGLVLNDRDSWCSIVRRNSPAASERACTSISSVRNTRRVCINGLRCFGLDRSSPCDLITSWHKPLVVRETLSTPRFIHRSRNFHHIFHLGPTIAVQVPCSPCDEVTQVHNVAVLHLKTAMWWQSRVVAWRKVLHDLTTVWCEFAIVALVPDRTMDSVASKHNV